jgi:hypothetical protein
VDRGLFDSALRPFQVTDGADFGSPPFGRARFTHDATQESSGKTAGYFFVKHQEYRNKDVIKQA